MAFVGTSKKEQRRLRPLLRELWVESVFSEDLYEDSVEAIRNFFQNRGHYAVDVQYRVETRDSQRHVTFDVDQQCVSRVTYLSHGERATPGRFAAAAFQSIQGSAQRFVVSKRAFADLARLHG